MTRLLPFLALAAGCTRDPTFYGYWDIAEAEVGGVSIAEPGFFEIGNAGSMSLFLRYTWDGGGFVPEPYPEMQFGATSAVPQEIFDNYKTKGETYTFTMDVFAATFHVDEYFTDEAALSTDLAVWPPGTEVVALTLYLRR